MLKLYCIFDKKTSTYLAPTMHVNDAEACRMLDHALRRGEDSLLSQYPDDYALYCIALFRPEYPEPEDKTRVTVNLIQPCEPPNFVTEVASMPIFAEKSGSK